MLVIYNKDTTEFNNLGLGVLRDIKSEPEITEVLNGQYNLEFEYIKDGWLSEEIIEGNIIKCNGQAFRIRDIKKNIKDGSIYVLAKHIWFDLEINNMLVDVAPTEKLGHIALQWILDHAERQTNFHVTGDCTKVASARYVRMNPIEAIYKADNSILNRFGGELEIDNYNITLHNKRGLSTGLEIRQSKNLTGATYEVDLSTLATRIMPVGNDGIMLPEIFVDSPLINNYYAPFYYKLDVDVGVDEEAGITLEDCYIKMREAVQELYDAGIDKPNVSISIDFVELAKTKEYEMYSNLETAHLGDSCRVRIPGLNIDLTTRIVKSIYNDAKKRITKIELGTPTPNYVTNNKNTVTNLYNAVSKVNTSSILEQAQQNASNLIKHPFGGYIYISDNTGELYIMDTDNPQTAQKVWKFGLGGIGYSSTGINGTYGIAITQDGSIVADYITSGRINTNLIEGYNELIATVNSYDGRIAEINITVSEILSKISDIADITIADSSDVGSLDLNNINASEPININIHPNSENISYLYPHNNLYPSSNLFSKTRTLRFTNKSEYIQTLDSKYTNYKRYFSYNSSTNDYTLLIKGTDYNVGDSISGTIYENNFVDYELPDDLLYYDSENYDEFYLDYDSQICRVTKRCRYNADGTVSLLANEVINQIPYPTINLNDGNYTISLLGYNTGYLFVRLMAANIYTSQFATRVEMNNKIEQRAGLIEAEVSQKLDTGDFTAANIILAINGGESSSEINADKISLRGKNINLGSENIQISSNNFSVDPDGHVRATSATLNDVNITGGTLKLSNNATISGDNGLITTLIYPGSVRSSILVGAGDFFPVGHMGGGDSANTQKSALVFNFRLPANFTIQSARVHLTHCPIIWDLYSEKITGYSRNLQLYKITDTKLTIDMVTYNAPYSNSYQLIPGAFGNNGFTGNPNSITNADSIDIKGSLSTNGVNMLAVLTSDGVQTGNNTFARTGGMVGYLEVIGYTKFTS